MLNRYSIFIMLLIVTGSLIIVSTQLKDIVGQGKLLLTQPPQKDSQILGQQPLQQQQQISNSSQVSKRLQISPLLELQQRNAPKPIEGVDNVVFKITSPDLLNMLNDLKKRLSHPERYSDYQLNTPLSIVFPIYARSSLSNFYIYPSELVDIKQKVLDSIAALSPSQFRNPNPNAIQIVSIKHDIYKQARGIDTCRNVIDFQIKSSDLAARISAAKVPTPDLKSLQSLYSRNIPINSELEIRVRPVTMFQNDPSQIIKPPLNVEQILIQTLFGTLPEAPVSKIPAVAPQDIAITSIDYIC